MFKSLLSGSALLLLTLTVQAQAPYPQDKLPDSNDAPKALSSDCQQNPVLIKAANETTGFKAEHQWVETNFPHSKWESQSMHQCPASLVDKVNFKTAQGESKVVYFDIGGFFGRF